jgi:prepilin-type N-terminal cleavage/methylation domain-containing protein
MGRFQANIGRPRGFSLIEVMIAVVVLATGLLALAALQGKLTNSSAEAKVRGRVAAMLATRMDELRTGGYGTLVPEGAAPPATSTSADACDPADPADWLDCTRAQAALGSLTVNQTITTWYGAGTFTTPAPNNPNPGVAQFKRIDLTASWADATGGNHQLELASDVSALALTNNMVPPPDDQTTGGTGPIVRTIDPATAGVIPIAMGAASDSATSNPIPELVGQRNNLQVVGTKFTVLNYTPPSNGQVVIQKRFENEVIKCACRYGAGGTNLPEIYRTAQWPAIWTGQRYDLYVPSPVTSAPGQAFSSGQQPNVEQSPLCQECCRDHHDTAATGVARFDPERSDGSVAKYDLSNQGVLQVVNNTNNGNYVDACRVIRVDGFWRTAADMYSRQFGLLETQSVNGVAAKSGLPTTNAVTAYTSFVKNYLKQYDGSTGNAPGNAQTMFDGTSGINVPALVTIASASNSDYRYLHGRGLYVDHLEDKARAKLTDVLADTGPQGRCPTGTAVEDCVLPYLPFTSANLTEIAKWVASNTSVLAVNSGNLLATDPTQPSGSRTIGKAPPTSDNTGSIRKSNSGVAVNAVLSTLNGVDPGDDTDVASDAQPFEVGGNNSTGPTFDVRVSGGGANPFVFFTLGTDIDKECVKPAGGDHHCVTATGTILPQAGALRLANYWVETTTTMQVTAICGGQTATDTIPVPTFRNYAVTAASIGGVSGTIGQSVNDNKKTEYTTIAFGSIPANGLVLATLTEQAGSPTYATVASCTTNGGHNKINNVTWTKPWELP